MEANSQPGICSGQIRIYLEGSCQNWSLPALLSAFQQLLGPYELSLGPSYRLSFLVWLMRSRFCCLLPKKHSRVQWASRQQVYLYERVLSPRKNVNPWARAKGLWSEVRGIRSSCDAGCSLHTVNGRHRRVKFKGEKALKVSEQVKNMVNTVLCRITSQCHGRQIIKCIWLLGEDAITATEMKCPDLSCSYAFGSSLKHLLSLEPGTESHWVKFCWSERLKREHWQHLMT